MYDHLGRRETLPGSFGVDLSRTPWGAGLKPKFGKGFVYSDARVDDARLVVFNVMDASLRGARVLVRTTLMSARRERDASGPILVGDAAGPIGGHDGRDGQSARQCRRAVGQARARHDQRPAIERGRPPCREGSHIIVPRVHEGAHAYILQNADKRIVFVIPYQERYTLIGTTDRGGRHLRATRDLGRRNRLPAGAINTYLAQPLAQSRCRCGPTAACVRSTTTARRTRRRSRATMCSSSTPPAKAARPRCPIYRRQDHHLSEAGRARARRVDPFLPPMRPRWTARAILPAATCRAGAPPGARSSSGRFPGFRPSVLRSLARRHGTRALAGPGRREDSPIWEKTSGTELFAAEIDYRRARGWAREGDDVLWRADQVRHRHVRMAERARVAAYVTRLVAAAA